MINWKGGYDKVPLEGAPFYVRQGKVNLYTVTSISRNSILFSSKIALQLTITAIQIHILKQLYFTLLTARNRERCQNIVLDLLS